MNMEKTLKVLTVVKSRQLGRPIKFVLLQILPRDL
jgi:hypothetical protein